MVAAVVKSTAKISDSNVATSAGSFGSLPSAGNAIIVTISEWHATNPGITSVADNQSNTYVEDVERQEASPHRCTSAVYSDISIGTPGGTFTITITPDAASANYFEWSAHEVSGLASPALDVTQNNASATGDASTGTTAATAQNDEIAFIVCSVANNDTNITLANDGSYTQLSVNQNATATIGHEAAYKVLSATGAQSHAWTHDNTSQDGWTAVIATYKAAAGGGGGTTVVKLAGDGGLAGPGGLAGRHGGLAG